MLPFYTLVASFLLFKGLGQLGLSYFEGWQTSLQGAVAVMLLLTASAHWGTRRPDLIRMVPPVFSRPDLIVTVTGFLEVAGAICILIPSLSKAASIGLALLLALMFPANVIAARERLTIGGRPVPKLLHRTALQVIFVGAILLAG
ncbi:DoxX family protein [Paenibacillus xerothermodurans]|uniref:DoxX family membrane protein n=1 Tax=Paenibacillus xerothermodurans TaxID=1977292 RepID=A0A2W1N7C2_PAEXE|nr:hypothetical protein [Paenibacillus xerothermodurans]PZE19041.1 hypothetical protein CBW46_020695 [Paenibacillus xerothermodurans]